MKILKTCISNITFRIHFRMYIIVTIFKKLFILYKRGPGNCLKMIHWESLTNIIKLYTAVCVIFLVDLRWPKTKSL